MIINELSKTNQTQTIRLTKYKSSHNIQRREVYLEKLIARNKELV
ncbi:chaperonin family protein RbcX [Cyanobacterium sp. uoEpiScrs1]